MRKLGLITALLVFLADQLSKLWLLFEFNLIDRAPIVLTPFANLVVVWNRGISFGMLSRHPENLALALVAMALVISGFLLHWLWKATHPMLAYGLGLVLGGAIGNVVDRLRYDAVFDFLDFHAFGYHWPAFNVADSAIVVGVLLLMLDSICNKEK